jgi:predicted DsbA family dithiol-disulfide isomerase
VCGVEVEIWSDVVCPWCYIGKRRFEAALAGFEHRDEVQVTLRSFELDPSAPRSLEVDGVTHIAEKYGVSVEQARAMEQNVVERAAEEGLELHPDIARRGNTFDAHRLLHLAAEYGLQWELKERLMRAYFSEGVPIGEPEALEPLATEVGLPADEVRDVLDSERYAADVRDDERTAAGFGISGVPFFVVDRSVGVSGAQPPEVLGELLRRGWSAAQQGSGVPA